jgi:hypothetical protein
VILRYLNKIKPLYGKASRRFPGGGEGDETDAEPDAAPSCQQPATPSAACAPLAPASRRG